MTLCIDRIVLSVSHWYYCPTSLSRPFFSTLIINLSSSFLQAECVGIIQDLPGTKIFKGYCIFWFEKLPVESNKKSRQYCLFYSCTGSVVFWLEQISFNNFSVESNKKIQAIWFVLELYWIFLQYSMKTWHSVCSCIPHMIFQVKTKQVACFELSTLQLSEANFDEPAKVAIDGSEWQMSVTKAK